MSYLQPPSLPQSSAPIIFLHDLSSQAPWDRRELSANLKHRMPHPGRTAGGPRVLRNFRLRQRQSEEVVIHSFIQHIDVGNHCVQGLNQGLGGELGDIPGGCAGAPSLKVPRLTSDPQTFVSCPLSAWFLAGILPHGIMKSDLNVRDAFGLQWAQRLDGLRIEAGS